MQRMSRRRLLQVVAMGGSALMLGQFPRFEAGRGYAAEANGHDVAPIKIGIIDPLSSPYKTSSIHDVHGASVAVDLFNKRGGLFGRPIAMLEADDASNPDMAVKAALKLIKEDHVDFLMGTLNGDCAIAVSEVAKKHNKLFLVTGAHLPELTREKCDSHTFVCMPNARMLARAVAPTIIKEYGTRWYMVTAETVDGQAAERAMTEACKALDGDVVGRVATHFGATDFTEPMVKARSANANVLILNLYGWDLVHALRAYAKAELAKDKVGVGGLIAGEQIGRPLGYAANAGIWGLIWDPKVNSEGSRRFIQAVIDKYHHTPTSRCYLGYTAATQLLEAARRAGSTETSAVIKALEGYEFDGLKEGRSYFRAWDHQHVQDVLVGKAYGTELGLGHYQIVTTVPGDSVAGGIESKVCLL